MKSKKKMKFKYVFKANAPSKEERLDFVFDLIFKKIVEDEGKKKAYGQHV